MTGVPPKVTLDLARESGLTAEEYDRIISRLGREPTYTELGLFSALWSEHCAYKHSRPLLALLPSDGPRVLVGPGENAGVLDIGDGVCIAFKMESHNHPSAVEPYQGAATGVGGILRDSVAMGARPIAFLDNLRFGEPDDPRMRALIHGVIEGIAGYANCVGVPTVGGDIAFDPGYTGNILVNVTCVGVADCTRITRAGASGTGNPVLYFGSPTGRDGLHGASFASGELNKDSLERRGAVQVGDPFMGKKILEASLELIRRSLVTSIQDMGAAGLTCSACEMAARGGSGIELNLDRVPKRVADICACELMLSESQERMLAVCTPESVDAALEVCARWECGGSIVGTVTDTGTMTVRHAGEVAAVIPVSALTTDAPVYSPRAEPPAPKPPAEISRLLETGDVGQRLLSLLASPTAASKRWAYSRYDCMVGTNTVLRPGEADAAVLRIRGTESSPDKFIALATGGSGRWTARDPYAGGQLAVCEAARNCVCVGAEPLGLTNCLNFGSPERPDVFWSLRRCIEGMADACRSLGIPVTGGNVSLYNENEGVAVPPTPMVAVVGLLGRLEHLVRPEFAHEGDAIFVLGNPPHDIEGTEYAKQQTAHRSRRQDITPCPLEFSLEAEVRLQSLLLALARAGMLSSAHDITEGGLAVALAECCLLSRAGFGASIRLPDCGQLACWLFGELPPRIVVSLPASKAGKLRLMAFEARVPIQEVGIVGGPGLDFNCGAAISIAELKAAHETPPFPGACG
ncbi:phosphoribosylformylglycinamidine synthase subunit PurL [Candidatus Poribacteria bacterium]|nr:phosphoribosylformylglycinamidine synthase subunit PurL [Candidatus Poribacteria bacterium]